MQDELKNKMLDIEKSQSVTNDILQLGLLIQSNIKQQKLKQAVKNHEVKMTKLEKAMRQNNIILFGIKEEVNEDIFSVV